MSLQAPSAVRRALTWLYWPVLALALIVAMGWLLGAITGPRHVYNAVGALGSTLFAALVGWRLWLNTRSLGKGGAIPSLDRLLRVFLPFGILALVGLFIVATGIAMIAGWWFVTFGEIDSTGGDVAPELHHFGLIGTAAMLVGAGLCWPLLRKLTRRRVQDVRSKSEDQHD